MAEAKMLNARLRKGDFGTAGARRIVRNGEIPAVVYGKMKPIHVIVNAKEFKMKKSQFSESTLITLKVSDEKDHKVFVKTYQENLLKDIINHIDFFEVTAGHSVRTHVRLELEGSPIGTKEGGVLDQVTHELEIECLPKDLPEVVKVDVSNLGLNETIRVSEVKVPSSVKVLTDPETAIASVKAVKEEAPVAEGEGKAEGAEPAETTVEKKEE